MQSSVGRFSSQSSRCDKCLSTGRPLYAPPEAARLREVPLRFDDGVTAVRELTKEETGAGLACLPSLGCPPEEHLHWRCEWCGFFWLTLTADART